MADHIIPNQHVPPPLLTLPKPAGPKAVRYVFPRQVKIYEYYTISNGSKRIFKNIDAISYYGEQKILPPSEVSYMNLFINAVLQPDENYTVEEGQIILHTDDLPPSGTPIILQMVKIV